MITIPNNTTNSAYDDFIELCKIQDNCVDKMFYCIDHNNKDGFIWYFEKWHEVTSALLQNPYNQVGHELDIEIINYCYINCKSTFDLYYDCIL